MNWKKFAKALLFIVSVLCGVVAGIMFTKLSFIDWPYVLGCIIFLVTALLIPSKKS
ncbi:MAG: hypothetical protein ACO3UL_02250 [Flavobacteriaceae bacterium]|nr:hypothetical protein [Bacteroidota bacterium]MDA0922799.1 hypothetical protein [Bacteroidota bacterium]MDA1289006.1 hypothetical protein [Bacteroidota bacterium]